MFAFALLLLCNAVKLIVTMLFVFVVVMLWFVYTGIMLLLLHCCSAVMPIF